MKRKIFSATTCLTFLLISATCAFGDYKIKQRTTMNGQKIESTVLVKGSRQRTETSGIMGMGADVATIEQCDLKRSVQVNDNKKLYHIDPFAADNSGGGGTMPAGGAAAAAATGNSPNAKTTRGGVVTMTYSVNDTGERKEMFGLTARHLKTVMTMQSSPDACMKNELRIETDGWYVDLPQFSCPVQMSRNPMAMGGGASGGCQDRFVTKQTGTGKLGFPLAETRTMQTGPGNNTSFTQTVETLEFSNAALPAVLFDVPKDYQLAKTAQDLYGQPDMSAMMRNMGAAGAASAGASGGTSDTASRQSQNNETAANAKGAGVVRIGVLLPSNKTSETISMENLRSFLTERLTSGKIEAVELNSAADARAMECDYVLSVDISKLKQSTASKIGGMFGKVTGTDTSAVQKYETQIDYKLTTPDGQVTVQNKAQQKSDGSAETVAEAALAQTVPAILTAANRKN